MSMPIESHEWKGRKYSEGNHAKPEVTPPCSDLTLDVTTEMPGDFVPFIESILWGTNGVRYRLKNFARGLETLPPHLHLSLRNHGRLLAARLAIPKSFLVDNRPVNAFYHTLLSVAPAEQRKGYGRMLASYTVNHLNRILGRKGFLYSYIEEGNTRSVNLAVSLGYHPFGQFYAHVIGRWRPRNSTRVFSPSAEDLVVLKRLLSSQYDGHALTDFDVSFSASNYWGLYEDGVPVAGAQALPQVWQIERLPGVRTSSVLEAALNVPVLRSLISLRAWRVLKISNIVFRQGEIDGFLELLETLLYRTRTNIALIFVDHRSPLYRELQSGGCFGLLDSLVQTKVNVWGLFHGLSTNECSDLERRPLAISAADI